VTYTLRSKFTKNGNVIVPAFLRFRYHLRGKKHKCNRGYEEENLEDRTSAPSFYDEVLIFSSDYTFLASEKCSFGQFNLFHVIAFLFSILLKEKALSFQVVSIK
jgi:hypothetical protein